MKLVEIITHPNLEWVSLCVSALCGLWAPVALVGGAGSEVSRDPILSWAVLAEVGLAMEGPEPRPGPGWLLPCSVAATSLSGVSRAQAAGAGALRVESRQVPLLRALPPPNAAPLSWQSRSGARDLDQALVADWSLCGKPARLPTLFSQLPPLLAESRQTRAPALREQSLGLSSPPVRPTVFTGWGLAPAAAVPSLYRGVSEPVMPPPPLRPARGMGPAWLRLLSSCWLCLGLYSLACSRAFPPGSCLCPAGVATHLDVFLMCPSGWWARHPPTLPSGSPLSSSSLIFKTCFVSVLGAIVMVRTLVFYHELSSPWHY